MQLASSASHRFLALGEPGCFLQSLGEKTATHFGSLRAKARQALFLLGLAVFLPTQLQAQVCASPGVASSLTVAAANTVINTYYPGTSAGGPAGTSVLGYASSSPRGSAAPIAAGDLVLIMQMQDGTGATITNSALYSFPATTAGNYEFARVVSATATALNLASNLINSYTQNTAAANNQTYQVIRVPQYVALTISSGASIVPAPWDGTSGGVVATDVAGAFTNNGSINASYAGFRGNAGLSLTGEAGAPVQTATAFDYVRLDTYGAHGGKGEGTAGTPPRVLNVFSSAGVLLTSGTTSANGTMTNATTAANGISSTVAYLNDATGRSYNGGSRAAGAPGNAGGGGDDAAPAANTQNSGGGGGGNVGGGGIGGNTWNTNIAVGGRGGNTGITPFNNKLVLGGGGGSSATNNGYGLDASGGAGGGLIFIKTGTVGGNGVLLADGQAGRSIPTKNGGADCPTNAASNCDGAGGGGAGGGIVVLATSGSISSAFVRGGQGGNVNGTIHGPGGGGGGGYTVASNPLSISSIVLGGVAGLTNAGSTTQAAYGAGSGAGGSGFAADSLTLPANVGGIPANCLPALVTTKVTSTPAATSSVNAPGSTTYSIVVANAAGKGDARGLTIYDPSLPGGTATVANPPLPSFAFSTLPTICALGSRTAVVDPANGATNALTAGTFSLPGGCTLTYTFTVNTPSTLPNGTYSNSALSWFIDPTVSTGRTVTAALPPAASGLAANSAFTKAAGVTVGGSNYDGNNAANTGDDIRVQRSANISITKTNGVTALVAGSTTSYTVTVANLGPADASGSIFKDPASAGLSCTAVTCTVAGGAAVCPAGVNITNLQSPPGAGITLTSLPAASSLSFVVTCGVTATGQ